MGSTTCGMGGSSGVGTIECELMKIEYEVLH